MQAIDNQFKAALAFAFTFVIVRVLSLVAVGQPVNVLAVLATYLILAATAVGLRRAMHDETDARTVRSMTYITLGALAATAPEFW
jgi:hypothetical protein